MKQIKIITYCILWEIYYLIGKVSVKIGQKCGNTCWKYAGKIKKIREKE